MRQFVPRLPGLPRQGRLPAAERLDRGLRRALRPRAGVLRRLARELSDSMGAVALTIGVENARVVRYRLFEHGSRRRRVPLLPGVLRAAAARRRRRPGGEPHRGRAPHGRRPRPHPGRGADDLDARRAAAGARPARRARRGVTTPRAPGTGMPKPAGSRTAPRDRALTRGSAAAGVSVLARIGAADQHVSVDEDRLAAAEARTCSARRTPRGPRARPRVPRGPPPGRRLPSTLNRRGRAPPAGRAPGRRARRRAARAPAPG